MATNSSDTRPTKKKTRVLFDHLPSEYDEVIIHTTCLQKRDLRPSQVYTTFDVVTESGEVIRAGDALINYSDTPAPEALIRQLRYACYIFIHKLKPKRHVQFHIHDISAFLLLTKNMSPTGRTTPYYLQRSRRLLNMIEVPKTLYLGDGGFKKAQKVKSDEIFSTIYERQHITPSYEGMGMNSLDHFEKQRQIRSQINA